MPRRAGKLVVGSQVPPWYIESMGEKRGFIVAAWEERGSPGVRVGGGVQRQRRHLFSGRLEDGRSFAAIRKAPPPAVLVAARDAPAAAALLSDSLCAGLRLDSDAWTDMAGAALLRISLPEGSLSRAEGLLTRSGIAPAGRERMRADETLASMGIRGPVSLRGEEVEGKRVDIVFIEPELEPAALEVELGWLAIDIETDLEERVVAASLAGAGGEGEVLFWGPELGSPGISCFGDEAGLLAALSRRIVERDPDVLTGWNVADFDLRVLATRFAAKGLLFDAGRTREGAGLVEGRNGSTSFNLPGRAVLDGLRLMRGSGQRYDDLSLETVARNVLGEGKSVAARGEAKLEELERLRREEPVAFCSYCLRDSELVLRILAKTGLDRLTAKRAALTGVSLDMAWTSIPAFERIYGSELRARRIVAPERQEAEVSGAAGGTVLDPATGLYPNVLVFDFRSLYPSIMRTFNVDPLAHARAEGGRSETIAPPEPGEEQIAARGERSAAIASRMQAIAAPNGAWFSRDRGIMPSIIERYAEQRELAIASGDDTAAYVYKILQNSFYGVLGAGSCRYARTELAGAITSFGRKFLLKARDFFEAKGMRVLYGDTDSVFVLSGFGDGAGQEELMALGSRCAQELNAEISRDIDEEYSLPSFLRIRCEKAYRRFLIPRLKSDPALFESQGDGVPGRGRAKGYAGLLLGDEGPAVVEVKGMEAARSDFTPLARRFQIELLGLVFAGGGEEELGGFCRETVLALRAGRLDEELVYRKSLRRPAQDYVSETPQVRAARLLGWTGRRGRVSYVVTSAGPEPLERRTGARMDYEHYVVHQLLPIARSIADVLPREPGRFVDAGSWFSDRPQLELRF